MKKPKSCYGLFDYCSDRDQAKCFCLADCRDEYWHRRGFKPKNKRLVSVNESYCGVAK